MGDVNLGNSYSGEARDLNLHNNITFVYCAFPSDLPYLTSQPQYLLLSSAKKRYLSDFGHFRELVFNLPFCFFLGIKNRSFKKMEFKNVCK